ncbi:TPA: hypothetical protein PFE14_003683 [Kluyvera ascorbata]|nr:hypothetical protein [Kluyvera ascorbata]
MMKLNIVSADELTDAVIQHLSRKSVPPATRSEKQIRQFLRHDDGSLAGILLHFSAAVSRLDFLARQRYGAPSQLRITFSLRHGRNEMHLLIENVFAFPLPVPQKMYNSAGKSIVLSLCIR